MAASYQGQLSVTGTAGRITTTANTPVGSGVSCVCSADVYYKTDSGVTTSNGMRIPSGVPFTINPGEFLNGPLGQHDLSTMYFITATTATLAYSVVL